MEIVESVDDLSVQDPLEGEFSSTDLKWTKYGTQEHYDDVAKIPYDRVDDFIIGECSNVEFPTRFHIERGRKRRRGSLQEYKSDEYLEYKLYWCSFGPENYADGGDILPSRQYRLNTRNRAARPQSMRGCTCHFVVKRLYAKPSLALIIYNDRRHVNKSGFPCHGPLDRDAIGPGAKKIPYVGTEIQQQTMSMIYLGIPEENVIEKHLEGIQRYCSGGEKFGKMASQYVQKLGNVIKRSSHELDLDDRASVRLWVERNKKSVFFYQESSDVDPFILGLQSEWQAQQMIRFGHQSIIAVDSTFGLRKLKYPLCTLVVFDSRQHALPVAWIITPSFAKLDTTKWMNALLARIHAIDSTWKVSGFVIDDAAAELAPIRDVFGCPVLFSLWRVRRAWLRNIVKKCSEMGVRRDIFKRLGDIVASIWKGEDSSIVIDKFMQDFMAETAFMKYFEDCWLPKIEMWLSIIRSTPLASLEVSSAIEAYHIKLKTKLYDDSNLGAFQRVDWLVYKLTAELHSTHWLDRYAEEHGTFKEIKENYINSTSWNRALKIPDNNVFFYENDDGLFAEVRSQKKDSHVSYRVSNRGSEFGFCDCGWALQGNLCKHVIKVNMMSQFRWSSGSALGSGSGLGSMSLYSFRELLTSLLRKPMDDSIDLDKVVALTHRLLNQVESLVEITNANDIGSIVNNHQNLKWVSRKTRSSARKRPEMGDVISGMNNEKGNEIVHRSRRKRKKLSTL